MTPIVCPQCFQPYAGIMCPFCAARTAMGPLDAAKMGQQYVGQQSDAATADAVTNAASSSAATPSSNIPATYYPSSSTSATVQPASWDDLELLYPFMWPNWLIGKIFDPSQETDSTTKRSQLGGIAQQLNHVRKTCTALPQTDQSNWDTFAKTFIPWFQKDPSIWDPTLDKPQADLLQDQLRGWQIEFAKYCNIGMPILPKATPTLSQLGNDFLEDIGKYLDTVKWIVVVGAGLFIVSVAIIGVDNTRKIIVKAVL
jgi:hypothetical protein